MTAVAVPRRADPKDVGTVRALYASGRCQAERCHAAIRWVPTVRRDGRGHKLLSGAPIPLDHGRDPAGPIVLDRDETAADGWAARAIVAGDDPGRPRYGLHWLTCIDPMLYREVRAAADPLGLLPARTQTIAAGLGLAGGDRCAACGEYRRHELGHLCLACARAAVAGWSPAMGPTIKAWPADLRARLGVEGMVS